MKNEDIIGSSGVLRGEAEAMNGEARHAGEEGRRDTRQVLHRRQWEQGSVWEAGVRVEVRGGRGRERTAARW